MSNSRRITSHGNAERMAKSEVFQGLFEKFAKARSRRKKLSVRANLRKFRSMTPQNTRRVKGICIVCPWRVTQIYYLEKE